MIENATITAVTAAPTGSKTGQQTYPAATAASQRFFLGDPMRKHQLSTDERIKTAEAFAYIPLSSGLSIMLNGRLTIVLDIVNVTRTYSVQMVNERVKGERLSHLEVALKEVR